VDVGSAWQSLSSGEKRHINPTIFVIEIKHDSLDIQLIRIHTP